MQINYLFLIFKTIVFILCTWGSVCGGERTTLESILSLYLVGAGGEMQVL